MNNKNILKLLFAVKNLLLIAFLINCINLIPNMYQQGMIGISLIILIVLYVLFLFSCYLKKDKNLNYNVMSNLLEIMLYVYVIIIHSKYVETLGLHVNDMYFKINYVIVFIGIIGVMLTHTMLLKSNSKKSKVD